MLDNGPLRSTFQLDYDAWDVNGKSVSESKIISLDAGSQLISIESKFIFKGKSDMPLAVGIVKVKASGEMLLNENEGIMGGTGNHNMEKMFNVAYA